MVILPSYGRDGGEDYDDITALTAQAGWRVLRPQPRGIAGSRGPMAGVTSHDLADDVAAVIGDVGGGRAVLLGQAFGHALSRMVAADHPGLVAAVILATSQALKVPADIANTPFITGDTAHAAQGGSGGAIVHLLGVRACPRCWRCSARSTRSDTRNLYVAANPGSRVSTAVGPTSSGAFAGAASAASLATLRQVATASARLLT